MLSVTQIRALKPKAKPYKVADAKGLFLLVQPSGALLWRVKYRFHGIERKISLGRFPDVSLKEAREKRDEARAKLEDGIDTYVERRIAKIEAKTAAESTFRFVADEFLEKMELEGRSPLTVKKNRWYRDLLDPDIGRLPVAAITPQLLLESIKRVEHRGHHETAQRLRAFASRVFRYACATVRADRNPAEVLLGAFVTPTRRHRAAILEPTRVGQLLRAIDGYDGRPETRLALQIIPHVFLRPGELRKGEWSEVDFEAEVWRIPAARMKMKEEHVVPLSSQVIALLKALKVIGNPSKYMFPAYHSLRQPMCDGTLNAGLRRLGYHKDEITSHGFRATASTLLNETGLWHPDAIERALAHKDSDRVRAAYHRGTYWDERVRMNQWWSDYLDRLRDNLPNDDLGPDAGAPTGLGFETLAQSQGQVIAFPKVNRRPAWRNSAT